MVVVTPDASNQIGAAANEILARLVLQLNAKHNRNKLRADFYDMKNLFRDLGIAIPPNLRNLEVAMGWQAKAVDVLARRVRMDAMVLPGGDIDTYGIPTLMETSDLVGLSDEATVSALIHATAFILTSDPALAQGSSLSHVSTRGDTPSP